MLYMHKQTICPSHAVSVHPVTMCFHAFSIFHGGSCILYSILSCFMPMTKHRAIAYNRRTLYGLIDDHLAFITCHIAPGFMHMLHLIKPNLCVRKEITNRYSHCVISLILFRFTYSTKAGVVINWSLEVGRTIA